MSRFKSCDVCYHQGFVGADLMFTGEFIKDRYGRLRPKRIHMNPNTCKKNVKEENDFYKIKEAKR